MPAGLRLKRAAPVGQGRQADSARAQHRRLSVRVQALTTGPSGQKVNKVVLAYSGGLDTSVILKWLQETYDCEVVTFTADLGQASRRHTGLSGAATAQPATTAGLHQEQPSRILYQAREKGHSIFADS